MKRVMIIFAALIGAMSTFAADENDQLLVFRNTGEVNLFYASEVDSIVCSYMDADSIVYDVLVSQVFYAKDTTLYVPIEEIDSVTYGCRNAMEYKKDAMAIDATHLEWIESYDGTYIHYKAHTPANIIPKEGTGLFFPAQESDIFPNGLCAKVEQVNGTIVCVRKAEFDEVFEKLFWAGELEMQTVTREANFDENIELNGTIEEGPITLEVNGGTRLTGRFVSNPFIGYYYGRIDLNNATLHYKNTIRLDDTEPVEIERTIAPVRIPPILGIMYPELTFTFFLDLKAELTFNYQLWRDYSQSFEIIRRSGNRYEFNNPHHKSFAQNDRAQIDITLNGDIYFGIGVQFELGFPLELAGARLRGRFGPHLEGEFGIGVIQQLSEEYDSEPYGKAVISSCLKLEYGGYTYLWGGNNENEVFADSRSFLKREINLFPEYEQTRAVGILEETNDGIEAEVSMATTSVNEIPHSVEMGFDLLTEDQTVVEEIWADSIYASETPADGIVQDPPQGVDTITTINLATEEEAKGLILQPKFRYAGYVVKAEPKKVMTDNNLQFVVFHGTNGPTSFLSGYPFIGEKTVDSTHYTTGPFMPTIPIDTVFNTTFPPIISIGGTYIGSDVHESLAVTWAGDIDGVYTELTFDDDKKGSITKDGTSADFTYTINQPQSGDVLLSLADGETLVFTIVSMDDESLTIRFKKDAKEYTLIKQ